MKAEERRALTAVVTDFNWAPTHEDVWASLAVHVAELNAEGEARLLESFAEAKRSSGGSPLGIAVLGPQGSGKTHLLRRTRERVQREGGYFFLVGLQSGKDFWQNVAHAMLSGLRRAVPEGPYQGKEQSVLLLTRLADKCKTTDAVGAEITGRRPPTRSALDQFIRDLRTFDRNVGLECQDTARALVLVASGDFDAQDVGEAYLTSQGEPELGDFARWGIHAASKHPQEVVTEISRLLALTGPSVLAVDQIDMLVAQMPTARDGANEGTVIDDTVHDILLEQIGDGLMGLREKLKRTLVVVACFPNIWRTLTEKAAVASVADRFRASYHLPALRSAPMAASLVEAWMTPRYKSVGFTPPYPTWPVPLEAFAEAPGFTPRRLLIQVVNHLRHCLTRDEVVPLTRLDGVLDESAPSLDAAAAEAFGELDLEFERLRRGADVTGAMNTLAEDALMPKLLFAGIKAWVAEQNPSEIFYIEGPPGEKRPAYHANLHRILNEENEDEERWAFRALAGPHHKTVIGRLEHLKVISGLDSDTPKRKACVLRTGPWSSGPATTKKAREFEAAGGIVVDVGADELAVFAALEGMFKADHAALSAWLADRRPASGTRLFRAVFGAPPPKAASPVPSPPVPAAAEAAPGKPSAQSLPLGNAMDTGTSLTVPLEALRKHAAIFAGSGSGKTVLIRRIVEECALRGVSSIVLDPNNDLARLGDAWPAPPKGWNDGDDSRAQEYFDNTEVVVWTPRRESGRPLSLQPLPDFAAVREDPDEFALALDTAVATLAPRARMATTTAKAEQGRAVLREALAFLGRRDGVGLAAFTDLLAELPEEVIPLAKARALAAEMAQTLTAAMINDPLFGGSGVALDPEVLLTPTAGRRARISVISFVGLPTNEHRQSFVNQLQMALFAWVKQHPAGDRPLGGLYVMDEAQTLAPSGALTACTGSTLALASQARKYGLGLIFATQSPKGIHNRIVGNAATQFYGFLNSPVQIAAAKELAAAKSSGVVDISRLSAGQFYAVGEGLAFQKVAAPMCLSHHPSSALSVEEVLMRARAGA